MEILILKNELLAFIKSIGIKELRENSKLRRGIRQLQEYIFSLEDVSVLNEFDNMTSYLDRNFMLTNNFNNLPCGEIK